MRKILLFAIPIFIMGIVFQLSNNIGASPMAKNNNQLTTSPRFMVKVNTTFKIYSIRAITIKNTGVVQASMVNSYNETMTIDPNESINIGKYDVNVYIDSLRFSCIGSTLKVIYYK